MKKFLILFILSILFILPKDSFALTVYSESFTPFQQTYTDNSWFTIESNFNNAWANSGSGYIRFQFTLIGLDQDNADSEGIPFSVHVQNGFGNKFICDIGSVNVANSTYNNAVYSAMCPVSFYNGAGLKSLHITIIDAKLLESATYNHGTLYFDGNVTLEVPSIPNNSDIVASQQQQLQKQQEILDETKKQTESLDDIKDSINSDDVTESTEKSESFFNDFNQDSHGLSGIVTAPLVMIQNLTGSKCEPLKFYLPFVNKEVVLPCMKPIYEEKFGIFYSLWQTITTGLIAYNVLLNMYKKVRDLQDPDNDKIEVLNL